jgi:hypothetical protein
MKPIVYFKGPVEYVFGRAIVTPINHPGPLVSNTTTVMTSKVVQQHGDGFETENTRYVRAD